MSLLLAMLMATASAVTPWWDELGDPGLVEAVEVGLDDNGDLAAAWERVEASRAMARQARAPLMPQVQANFSSSTAPYDSLGFQFGLGGVGQAADPPSVYHTGSYGLAASWELDLFGRSYTTLRAATIDARAASGDRDGLAMTLASQIASLWYDIVAAEQRLLIVRRQIETQERTLELTQLRFEGADATGLDVLQQRQQLAATRTLLPVLEMQRRVQIARLSMLIGRELGDLPERPAALPVVPALPPVVATERLVETRPDLVAAEERVLAARSRKRAAVLGAMPTVRLTASAGSQFSDFGEWDSQKVWNVGTSASVPLFTGGRTFEGVRAARSGQLAAEHTRDQLKRFAEGEVAGAVVREEEQRAYVAAVSQQLEAATLAHEAARQRYRTGSAAYINVLTASNAELQAQLTSVQAHRDLLGIHLELRDAMGGAWADELGERAKR